MKFSITNEDFIILSPYIQETQGLITAHIKSHCMGKVTECAENSQYKKGDILLYDNRFALPYVIKEAEYIICKPENIIAKVEL